MSTETIPSRPRTTASEAASVAEEKHNAFASALTDYILRLGQIGAVLQETQQQAARYYWEITRQTIQQTQSKFAVPYTELLNALQGQDAERLKTAHAGCTDSARNLQSEAIDETNALLKEYDNQVRAAWEQARASARQEYESYLDRLTKALSHISPEELEPISLAMIGQGLMTAASYAAMVAQALAIPLSATAQADPDDGGA